MISIRYKDGDWEVWTDVSVDEFCGRCLGASKTKSVAIALAYEELRFDLEETQKAISKAEGS